MPSRNLQDVFLGQCRRHNARCVVYLVNGVQLRGMIRAFDNFTLLLEDDGAQQIVYKHAVTTVQPVRPLPAGWDEPERALDQDPLPSVAQA